MVSRHAAVSLRTSSTVESSLVASTAAAALSPTMQSPASVCARWGSALATGRGAAGWLPDGSGRSKAACTPHKCIDAAPFKLCTQGGTTHVTRRTRRWLARRSELDKPEQVHLSFFVFINPVCKEIK